MFYGPFTFPCPFLDLINLIILFKLVIGISRYCKLTRTCAFLFRPQTATVSCSPSRGKNLLNISELRSIEWNELQTHPMKQESCKVDPFLSLELFHHLLLSSSYFLRFFMFHNRCKHFSLRWRLHTTKGRTTSCMTEMDLECLIVRHADKTSGTYEIAFSKGTFPKIRSIQLRELWFVENGYIRG